MTKYCGYMGRVVLLDLSERKAEDYLWTDLDREKYIGGEAMAFRILYDNLTGKETAFDPGNLIVIATGPLTGTGAPSSNRFDISSLSPLTGITASSNCGGNFGHYLEKAGQTPRGKADFCMFMQDLMEAISMGGQCLFSSYGLLPAFLLRKPNGALTKAANAVIPYLGPAVRVLNKLPEIASFNLPLLPYPVDLRYTTGMKMNIGRFIRCGERSYNVERAVNARFGVSEENDKLPKRLTDIQQDPKRPDTRVPLEQMKKTYYRARGWEKNAPL